MWTNKKGLINKKKKQETRTFTKEVKKLHTIQVRTKSFLNLMKRVKNQSIWKSKRNKLQKKRKKERKNLTHNKRKPHNKKIIKNQKENITKSPNWCRSRAATFKRTTVSYALKEFAREITFGLVLAATFLCTWNVSRLGFLTSTETKTKVKSSSRGVALNASLNTTKQCPNITVIAENSRTQSMKETLNPIHVDKFVGGKEDLTALIRAPNFVIKENANHANIKELL